MGSVIILEGPDGGGKTTLARQLEHRGYRYHHEGPPAPGIDLLEHYLEVLHLALTGKDDVVFDRLYLGEHIYGPIARGVDRVTYQGVKLFERLRRSKPIHQYLCLPPKAMLDANYSVKMLEKDDYLRSLEKYSLVVNSYTSFIDLGWGIYDYTQMSVDSVLENMYCESGAPHFPVGAIGCDMANYLFIGDKANHPSLDVPFFSLTGSSGYLNKALHQAGVYEDNVALYNANDPYGNAHTNFNELLQCLPLLTHIIAMGSEAREFLNNYTITGDIKFRYIHHPSYLKRFKGNNPAIMADMIREAIHG